MRGVMEISLRNLASLIGGTHWGPDRVISSITAQSNRVAPAALFVAVRGEKADGHDFIAAAFDNGALAAVVERREALGDRSGIAVSDTRLALSKLASLFAGDPASKMHMVAITGTNGKTTTNWLVFHALENLGVRSLRIGTIGTFAEGVIDAPGELTTPDPITLHETLARAYQAGIRSCVIEASSHALDQKRVEHLCPDVAVFSNLTRDHLDYHGSMERYFAAKSHLFSLLADSRKSAKAAVVNIDDPHGLMLWESLSGKCADFSFGRSDRAAIKIREFSAVSSGGSRLKLETATDRVEILTPLIGDYNGYNLTAAFGSCVGLGFSPADVARALEGVGAAPGRLEMVKGIGFAIYIDYAHTPDALERALLAVRPATSGRLWVVFGCGGDRDRGKRPQMGAIAARLADEVVVTSDNPRTEDPQKIIDEIIQGANSVHIEPDRRAAIELVISRARSGDVVLIAGKGHEDYQIIGRERVHFSDRSVAEAAVKELLLNRGAGSNSSS